jgi:DNA-binding response OmpR family regulator
MMKVLIASDSPAKGESLVKDEKRFDCTGIVTAIRDEEKITRAVTSLKPDVLILNMQVLGRAGVRILQSIRQKSSLPIVIILTDDKGLQHRKDCVEAGAHFIFDKTTETYKIQEVLTRLIQGNNMLKDSCMFEFWENLETAA